MRQMVHLLLAICMLLGVSGIPVAAAAQNDAPLDLADVPLPVQDLPESGYQVMAGGYLADRDLAPFIADPRNLDSAGVQQQLDASGVARAYVLDLMLPEDRGWVDSPPIALIQTSVYLVDEGDQQETLIASLLDYSNTAYVEDRDSAVDDATTIAFVGPAGDQLRTVVTSGNVVIEILSLDATGAPSETEHGLIVEATLDRLDRVRDGGQIGLSSLALTFVRDDTSAGFFNAQQSGVHGLYRLRDGVVQPAIGELGTDDLPIPAGLQSHYLASNGALTGSGTGFLSVWLGAFDSDLSAGTYFETLVTGDTTNPIVDPYFTIAADEGWTEQGVLGVYRVSGTYQGQRYSGSVEIRLQGSIVSMVGYRSIGTALPGADLTSQLMDHQLECLEIVQTCAPFDLASATPAVPQASPVVDGGALGSAEFGWSLPQLGPDWTVTEQFVEPGYDRLSLQNGVSIVELESVINHHGDPVQCVLDELQTLQDLEEHSYIRVWEDADGNTDGGRTSTNAWVVYRVEPLADERADQEYAIRIDCFTLVPQSANLVVTHIAPIDAWESEQAKVTELRERIRFPSLSAWQPAMLAPVDGRSRYGITR